MKRFAVTLALAAFAASVAAGTAQACEIRGIPPADEKKSVSIWLFVGCAPTTVELDRNSFPRRLQAFLDNSGGLEVASITPNRLLREGVPVQYVDTYTVITKRDGPDLRARARLNE